MTVQQRTEAHEQLVRIVREELDLGKIDGYGKELLQKWFRLQGVNHSSVFSRLVLRDFRLAGCRLVSTSLTAQYRFLHFLLLVHVATSQHLHTSLYEEKGVGAQGTIKSIPENKPILTALEIAVRTNSSNECVRTIGKEIADDCISNIIEASSASLILHLHSSTPQNIQSIRSKSDKTVALLRP
jgi:hypothetical protein